MASQLNGNQVQALSDMFQQEDFFHFWIYGTDRLDSRILLVEAMNYEGSEVKRVGIDQNGTVTKREGK